ncbi:MAG: hypothetical protein ACI8WB_002088 [Phenylobacterium sp.]|jgi:hypothetical protein
MFHRKTGRDKVDKGTSVNNRVNRVGELIIKFSIAIEAKKSDPRRPLA